MEGAEEKTSVAIVDSIYEPGDFFRKKYEVVDIWDGLNHRSDDKTNGHGIVVSDLISSYSQNTEYYFYRVIRQGGDIEGRDLLNAIGKAHLDHEVDVINLSLGTDHSDDGNQDCIYGDNPCRVREAIQEAGDDGISIVSAIGNDDAESIHCPAIDEKCIGVGGYTSLCEKRLSKDNPLSIAGKHVNPPLACWIGRESEETFCTGLGCTPFDSCDDHRKNVVWDQNPPNTPVTPDILAPAIIPGQGEHGPEIFAGTSFATPHVTAALAEMHAGIKAQDERPSPELLKRAVIKGADSLDEGPDKKFSAEGAHRYVCDRMGWKFESASTGSEESLFRS